MIVSMKTINHIIKALEAALDPETPKDDLKALLKDTLYRLKLRKRRHTENKVADDKERRHIEYFHKKFLAQERLSIMEEVYLRQGHYPTVRKLVKARLDKRESKKPVFGRDKKDRPTHYQDHTTELFTQRCKDAENIKRSLTYRNLRRDLSITDILRDLCAGASPSSFFPPGTRYFSRRRPKLTT